MKLPNFVLCLVIFIFGTIAIKSFTNANSDSFGSVKSDVDVGFNLSDSDLDRIHGIVDEKLDPIREDLRTVEKSLSERIDDLQERISDCSSRCDEVKAMAVVPVKSGGSSGNTVGNKYETKSAVVQNVYSQPVVRSVVQSVPVQSSSHWTYPGDITTHMQVDHGQSVSGMTVEQQLSFHDSIHESQPRNATRTVTRSNLQTSSCPGGVCPTSSSMTTRSTSSPRLFGRLFGR